MNDAHPSRVLHAIGRLQRLAELFHVRRAQLARQAGLTEAQWRLLEEIATEDFMPSMFARASQSSPPAVSRLLRQLADRDLISVSLGAQDGRQRRYALTPAGRRLLDRLRRARSRAVDTVWLKVPPREIDDFIRFSNTLIPKLEAYAAAGHQEA